MNPYDFSALPQRSSNLNICVECVQRIHTEERYEIIEVFLAGTFLNQ
tara:strand:+ start:378 stop:518 length:141 start_codon:yes stop_codon:yes gene_type:complete